MLLKDVARGFSIEDLKALEMRNVIAKQFTDIEV